MIFEIDYNNYSEKEKMKLIKESGFNIFFIKDQTEEMQLEAIRQNPYFIRWTINPTKKVQLEAVKQRPEILNNIKDYINNPCQEILDMLMIKDIIE